MVPIQWFPGHMAKTRRILSENLKRVDVIIEVLDARAPLSSANPLLRSITRLKPRLIILNKDDLADPTATALWARQLLTEGLTFPLQVSGITKKGLDAIPQGCRKLCYGKSWLIRRPLRALITGIPNVGKSTIINGLSRKKKAEAGATPGLTRDLRRIPISRQLELFDTPGLLWHKFENPLTGIILAAIGAIKETILPDEEVAGKILTYLAQRYPNHLTARYQFDGIPIMPHELIETIGRKRGCLSTGSVVDVSRVCQLVLKDIREGKFGAVSLEWPDGEGWSSL